MVLGSVISALIGGAGGSITTLQMHGNRITSLEVRVDMIQHTMERIDRKLDRLLDDRRP